jgi:hypothetical protein
MKQMLLALFFLILIIAGSLMTIYYINHQSDALQNQLVELERQVDRENWDIANSRYNDFKENWDKVDHIWSMLIDHYEIDNINMNLGELEAFIKTMNKEDALAKISSLQWLVKHIPEKEFPTLKNIL